MLLTSSVASFVRLTTGFVLRPRAWPFLPAVALACFACVCLAPAASAQPDMPLDAYLRTIGHGTRVETRCSPGVVVGYTFDAALPTAFVNPSGALYALPPAGTLTPVSEQHVHSRFVDTLDSSLSTSRFDLSVGAHAMFSGVSVDAERQASDQRATRLAETGTMWEHQVWRLTGVETFSDPELSAAALAMSPTEFRRMHGTHYVNAVYRGYELVLTFTANSRESSSRTETMTALKAAVSYLGNGGTVNTGESAALENFSRRAEVSVRVHVRGGTHTFTTVAASLSDRAAMQALAGEVKQYLDTASDAPAVLACSLNPFSKLRPNLGASLFTREAQRQDDLMWLYGRVLSCESARQDVEEIRELEYDQLESSARLETLAVAYDGQRQRLIAAGRRMLDVPAEQTEQGYTELDREAMMRIGNDQPVFPLIALPGAQVGRLLSDPGRLRFVHEARLRHPRRVLVTFKGFTVNTTCGPCVAEHHWGPQATTELTAWFAGREEIRPWNNCVSTSSIRRWAAGETFVPYRP